MPTEKLAVITEVWVPMPAKTKGSLTHVGNGHMAESVAGSKGFRAAVAAEVHRDRVRRMTSGVSKPTRAAVSVRIACFLPIGWDDIYELTKQGSGDADKIERNVLDALTDAGAYVDDAQGQRLLIEKYGQHPSGFVGVLIQCWEQPDFAVMRLGEQAWADALRVATGLAEQSQELIAAHLWGPGGPL